MKISRKDLRFDLILFAAVALWFSLFALMSADPHHDGVMFKAAWDVAAGRTIFRETFAQYGPFTPMFQGAAIMLFGRELLVIKLQTVLFYALSAVALRHFLDGFLRRGFRDLALAFFFIFPPFYVVPMHPWSSVYALFFMLLAGCFMLRIAGEEGDTAKNAALTGLAAFFAFGCRHPCGLVTLTAGAIVLFAGAFFRDRSLRQAWKGAGFLLGGFALPLALLLLWLWAADALEDYFTQCFAFIVRFGWKRGGGGDLWQLFITFFPYDSTFVVFPLCAFWMFGRTALRLFRRDGDRKTLMKAFAAAVFALASYHQYYPVPCVRHLYWAAVPLFGAFAFCMQDLFDSVPDKRLRCAAAALLMLYPAITGGMRMYALYWRLESLTRRSRLNDIPGLRGMLFLKGEVYYYRRMKAMFDLIPPDIRQRRFVNHTPDGLLSIFFRNDENFHPMFVNWRNDVYPDYERKLDDFVRENDPVILSDSPERFENYFNAAGFPGYKPCYFLLLPLK